MVQQQRGHQHHQQQEQHRPVAGPSSPPKGSRASQPQSRHPRRSGPFNETISSAYGYGGSSQFGSKPRRNGEDYSRAPGGSASPPNVYGHAYASTSRPPIQTNHYYAMSAPLPPAGSPLPPTQALQAMPPLPSGPRSLTVQPQGSSRIIPAANASTTTQLQSSSTIKPPLPAASRRQTPPPPSSLPPSIPSSSASTSKTSRPLAATASSASLPSSIPSAPRAMRLTGNNPLKGKGPVVSVLSGDESRTPTTEELARAALSKSDSASSAPSQLKPSSTDAAATTNGTAMQSRKTLKIAISKPNGVPVKKQAFAVIASSPKLPTSGQTKHVNVLEEKERQLEKARQEEKRKFEEEALKAVEELKADAKAFEARSIEHEDEAKHTAVTGLRYTPPPRNTMQKTRTSRWDADDSRVSEISLNVSHNSKSQSERSHTPPPRRTSHHDRGHTPPPRSRQPSLPQKPSSPASMPIGAAIVQPSKSTLTYSPPPPPPPPLRRSATPPPPPSTFASTSASGSKKPAMSLPRATTTHIVNMQLDTAVPAPPLPSLPTPASPNTPAERYNSSLYQKPRPATISLSLSQSLRPKTDTPSKRRNLLFDEALLQPTETKQEVPARAVEIAAGMQEDDKNLSSSRIDTPVPPTSKAPGDVGPSSIPESSSQSVPHHASVESSTVAPTLVAPSQTPVPANWLMVYDGTGDRSAAKQSKPMIKREDGKGVPRPVLDPRGTHTEYEFRLLELIRAARVPIRSRLSHVSYSYDEHSCGPPPPLPASSIVIVNISKLVTIDKIKLHFSQYGRIEDHEYCSDKLTSGFLGICRIKYADEVGRVRYIKGQKPKKMDPSGSQDGHSCAKTAVEKNHHQKVVSLAGNNEYLRVYLDGDGSRCKWEVKQALVAKYPKSHKEQSAAGLQKAAASLKPQTPQAPGLALPVKPEDTALGAKQKALPAGDDFLQRSDHSRTPERSYSNHASSQKQAATPRGPYRLPPVSSRSQVGMHGRPAQRHGSDRDQSDSDSDMRSDVESDYQSDRWDDKKDRIYDTHSRAPRRLVPPPKAISISDVDRFHIFAMEKLSLQPHPYVVLQKKELQQAGLQVPRSSVQAHFRSAPVKDVFDDRECWYLTFRNEFGARRCYHDFAAKHFGAVRVVLRYEKPPSFQDVEDLKTTAHNRAVQAADVAREELSGGLIAPAGRAARPDIFRKAEFAEARIPAREVVNRAKKAILQELEASFSKDLRQRLAAPYVIATLNEKEAGDKDAAMTVQKSRGPTASNSRRESDESHAVQLQSREASQAKKHQPPQTTAHSVENDSRDENDTFLPSFGKQQKQERPPYRDARAAAKAYALKRATEKSNPQDIRPASDGSVDNMLRPLQVEGEQLGTAVDSPSVPAVRTDGVLSPSRQASFETVKSQRGQSPRKANKTSKKVKSRKAIEVLHFTSSEEDSEEEEVPLKKVLAQTAGDADNHAKTVDEPNEEEVPIKVEKVPEEAETVLVLPTPTLEEAAPLEAVIHLPTPAPSDSVASSNKRELSDSVEESSKRRRLASTTPSEPATPVTPTIIEPPAPKPVKAPARKAAARGRGKGKRGAKQKKKESVTPTPEVDPLATLLTGLDQEDLFYLKIALQRQKQGLPLPPLEEPVEEEDEDIQIVEPRHETGSARTEGYYKIPQAEKLRYLLARNQGKSEPNKEGNSSLSVSRLARVNARHLASGLDKHKKATATDTDLLQLNQLRTRKKQLRFARSPIHDWGLYALEHIPAGEMVIEYVGEQIRQQVADKREKAYERQGIGSSYLFRVDDDVVIDATMKGNLGRLINHCCTPNCTAKILSVGNSKKIVIYAKQVINKGDEITYDYHFPIEDEKIVCLCGSSGCRGFLN